MRQQFPALGSQMICNAIYSVSRTARDIYQGPASPWNVAKLGAASLPLLRFTPTAPVYFDRHTVSFKGNGLSVYTLDGRSRFSVTLDPAIAARFANEKLLEAVMVSMGAGFALVFHFDTSDDTEDGGDADELALPDYVTVIPPSDASASVPDFARALELPGRSPSL
jgi:hypothetical protein